LKNLALVGFGHLVGAQSQGEPLRVGHWSDSLGIDFLHSADQLEYPVQLGLDRPRFGLAYADPGERGDVEDLF
jgi:hypothetical protein